MHMGGNQPQLPAAGCPQLPAVLSCRLSAAASCPQLPTAAAAGCPQLRTGRPATRGWIKIGGRFSFFLWIKNAQARVAVASADLGRRWEGCVECVGR